MLLLSIIFTAHFLACFWFLVGTFNEFNDGEGSTPSILGWVEREATGIMSDGEVSKVGFNRTGDCAPSPNNPCISDGTRYSTSMYYVFNPVENAETDVERIYAVVAYLLLVIIDGSVAGLISATLVGMNGADQEVTSCGTKETANPV